MRRHIISILLAVSLLAFLAAPALGDGAAEDEGALGERVDEWTAYLAEGAELAGESFWTGSDLRTEYRLTLAPGSTAVPVVVSGEPLRAQRTLLEAAEGLEAEGLHVLGGVNGGFYTVATGEPVGLALSGGALLHDDEGLYAVGFRPDGGAVFGRPAGTQTLRAGEAAWPVAAWNRLAKAGFSAWTPDCDEAVTLPEHTMCALLTAPEAPGLSGEWELTVERAFVSDGAAFTVPEGTLLLTLPPVPAEEEDGEPTAPALPEAFAEGAAVTLQCACAEGWEDVESAVGILYPLIENGEIAEGLTASAAPRTAIGLREDGTLILYALDGRRSGHSVGGGLTHAAERLLELGCVTAGALDGGGSTQIAAFLPGDAGLRIFNRPSDGKPREVANYILLAVPAAPTGEAAQLSLEPLHINAVAGAAIPLTVRAADENGFGALLPEELTFTVSDGLGEVRDGQYYAAGTGSGTLTVSAPGLRSASIPIRVTESPEELLLYGERYGRKTEKLTLEPGYEVDLTVRAYDRHILLSGNDLCYTWSLESAAGTVDETGHLIPGPTSGTGMLTVAAGERAAEIPITVWTGVPFRDVPVYDPDFDAIRYVYEHGLFQGTAEDVFEPETVMNRAMLVTVLWRMEGEPAPAQPAAFADVAPDAWYAAAVAWAAENGIVNGYSAEQFAPEDDLTLEQILAVLHRRAGTPEPPEGEDAPVWPEDTDAHGWALAALRWAAAAGVCVWDETAVPAPRAPMDRAGVADVLMRYDSLIRPNLTKPTEDTENTAEEL